MQRRVSDGSRQTSAARLWAPLGRFIELEAAIGGRAAARGPAAHALYEFVRFGMKQAWACLFGALMLALLIATHLFYPHGAALARYDFLVIAAVLIQVLMLAFRLETGEEAKIILAFHAVGTVMEVFKTSVGSWVYPEASLLRVGGVPLFTGFMYAAIGSYIARCWPQSSKRNERQILTAANSLPLSFEVSEAGRNSFKLELARVEFDLPEWRRRMTMSRQILAGVFSLGVATLSGAALAAEETPIDVLAARVREQGHTCDKPQSAQRENKESAPNAVVWVLKCENESYRLTLIPDMASKVEKLSK
jgi:hypothetical protein